MSKSALKKYLAEQSKKQLEAQVIDLYERFAEVKTFYDYVFNPKEDKLLEQAKIKIGKEYFPETKRRAKKRRSVAQKIIKHFKQLGVDPTLLADVMLYNIEIAQTYTAHTEIKQAAFYKSMFTSFSEALKHIAYHGLRDAYSTRIEDIVSNAEKQRWENAARSDEAVDFYLIQE